MNELDSSLAYLVAMTTACREHNHGNESLSGDIDRIFISTYGSINVQIHQQNRMHLL